MHTVHSELAGIDLNLLLALDVLLSERHVTRAAARLGVTQSAASHALAKLRAALGDPLLVRGPTGAMVTTPRADALAPSLRVSLEGLAGVVRSPAPFDPRVARLAFHVGTGDYAEVLLLPRLVERLSESAPGISIWMHPLADYGDAQLVDGSIDLVISPPRGAARPAGSFERALFGETFTCVVRSGHPLASRRLTLARYCAARHVLVTPRGTPGSFVDDALAAVGKTRQIALAVPHFLVVPHIVQGSDLVATLATRLAARFERPFGLTCLVPPIPMAGFGIGLAWHERRHHDPAHRWFREEIAAVAREITFSEPPRGSLQADPRATPVSKKPKDESHGDGDKGNGA